MANRALGRKYCLAGVGLRTVLVTATLALLAAATVVPRLPALTRNAPRVAAPAPGIARPGPLRLGRPGPLAPARYAPGTTPQDLAAAAAARRSALADTAYVCQPGTVPRAGTLSVSIPALDTVLAGPDGTVLLRTNTWRGPQPADGFYTLLGGPGLLRAPRPLALAALAARWPGAPLPGQVSRGSWCDTLAWHIGYPVAQRAPTPRPAPALPVIYTGGEGDLSHGPSHPPAGPGTRRPPAPNT